MMAPVIMPRGVSASNIPLTQQAATCTGELERYASLMKASSAAAAGIEMLVGSSSCLTTVTVTRNAMGRRHKMTAPAGPL